MRMKISPTVCVVLLTLSGGATANEPGKSEAVAATREGPAKTELVVPVMGAEELRKRIQENPNAVVDLSQWTSITPEIAEVVICRDDEVRPVRRTQILRYTVKMPGADDAEDGRPAKKTKKAKTQLREKQIECVVAVPGRALRLNGVGSLTWETAAALGRHIGDLELNGLRELDQDVAAELASHQGALFLDGLESLPGGCEVQLCDHEGPVSLRGITRLTPETYGELARFAWLPPSVIIEQESPAFPDRFVRWSGMAVEDTVDNYVRHMTAQTNVTILVDTDALKRVHLSSDDKVSAPVGIIETSELVGISSVVKSSARVMADRMVLEEAVVWLAWKLDDRLKEDSKESVVALTNGDSFLLTVRPKLDKQQGTSAEEEIQLSKDEKSMWYRCKGRTEGQEPVVDPSGWQPPWKLSIVGGMGGGAF